jgi:hypothetical protein
LHLIGLDFSQIKQRAILIFGSKNFASKNIQHKPQTHGASRRNPAHITQSIAARD